MEAKYTSENNDLLWYLQRGVILAKINYPRGMGLGEKNVCLCYHIEKNRHLMFLSTCEYYLEICYCSYRQF
jgi:hypothetical protein